MFALGPFRSSFLVPFTALVLAATLPGLAFGGLIIQAARVAEPFPVRRDALDTVDDGGTGRIPRDVLAELSDPDRHSYSGVASVGRFGAIGVQLRVQSPVEVDVLSEVLIANNEFRNLTGVGQRATSRVIVDGGRLQAIDVLPNSEIDYFYTLSRNNAIMFTSIGQLRADPLGHLRFDLSGNLDLGATFDLRTSTVTIPTSFQTFDLGIIPAGGTFTLDGGFVLNAFSPGGDGLLLGQYSDPFHLSANPVLGTLTLEPVVSQTPEPGTLTLLGVGGVVYFTFRRLRPGARFARRG